MQITELRFLPNGKHSPDSSAFLSLTGNFITQLWRGGLILDGWQIFISGGETIYRVTAQDEDAVDQSQMSYDAKKALEKVLPLCAELPKVIPGDSCFEPSHCTCEHPSWLLMQSPGLACGSPLACGDCGKNYPLYRTVRNPAEREFDTILEWQSMRHGILQQFMSNLDAATAKLHLSDCVSDLSLAGRQLAGNTELATGILTLYPLFSYYETPPELCPQCGNNWVNEYRDAVPFQRFCRECRLVM